MFKSIRFWSGLFGVFFILAGVAGFSPMLAPNEMLFGLFMVNTMHNAVHIISGVIAILAATKANLSRIFFIVFGILYLITAIVGFARHGDVFGMHMNMMDNFLHLAIAIVALYFGLLFKGGKQ